MFFFVGERELFQESHDEFFFDLGIKISVLKYWSDRICQEARLLYKNNLVVFINLVIKLNLIVPL